jgi:predicted SnoaL-like aldol condensation-catalyzing enzyme
MERNMDMTIGSQEARANALLVMNAIGQVFDRHDIGAMDQFFSRNFVQHSPYVPSGGPKELAVWWRRMVDAIPDIRGTIEHVVAAQNHVAVFRMLKGTISKDMPDLGLKASDQPLEFRVAHLFQVEGGGIVAHWEVMDTGPGIRLALKGTPGR